MNVSLLNPRADGNSPGKGQSAEDAGVGNVRKLATNSEHIRRAQLRIFYGISECNDGFGAPTDGDRAMEKQRVSVQRPVQDAKQHQYRAADDDVAGFTYGFAGRSYDGSLSIRDNREGERQIGRVDEKTGFAMFAQPLECLRPSPCQRSQ
jgi:hypothetical protein